MLSQQPGLKFDFSLKVVYTYIVIKKTGDFAPFFCFPLPLLGSAKAKNRAKKREGIKFFTLIINN